MQEWNLGWEKCVLFRGVLIEGFHCNSCNTVVWHLVSHLGCAFPVLCMCMCVCGGEGECACFTTFITEILTSPHTTASRLELQCDTSTS